MDTRFGGRSGGRRKSDQIADAVKAGQSRSKQVKNRSMRTPAHGRKSRQNRFSSHVLVPTALTPIWHQFGTNLAPLAHCTSCLIACLFVISLSVTESRGTRGQARRWMLMRCCCRCELCYKLSTVESQATVVYKSVPGRQELGSVGVRNWRGVVRASIQLNRPNVVKP